MTDLVFLDTETTGLDPDKHEVWEIALAVNDDPVQVYYVEHALRSADLNALELNGYWQRMHRNTPQNEHDLQVRHMIEGNTLVCANPTFDRMMLRKRWGFEPYHYRSIDVESMALVVFGWDRPRGLKDIAAELRGRGYDIPEPDHSAAKDVEVLRKVFKTFTEDEIY